MKTDFRADGARPITHVFSMDGLKADQLIITKAYTMSSQVVLASGDQILRSHDHHLLRQYMLLAPVVVAQALDALYRDLARQPGSRFRYWRPLSIVMCDSDPAYRADRFLRACRKRGIVAKYGSPFAWSPGTKRTGFRRI